MYQVTVDAEQKLVEVQLNGFVKVEDAVGASNEIKKTFKQFGPGQAVLLVDLVGFAPMAQDVIPVLRGLGRDVATFFHKTALVQDFPMKFQGRPVIEPPPGYQMPTFPTREKALAYLTEA